MPTFAAWPYTPLEKSGYSKDRLKVWITWFGPNSHPTVPWPHTIEHLQKKKGNLSQRAPH